MAKKHTTLFNPKFLEEQLKNFSLDTIPNISNAKNAINEWNRKIKEGVVDATKEESQNPLFAECIFERALGYRKSIKEEGNDDWNLYLEKKTKVDGTKPDLTLGFFTSHSSLTRVVVELKDSSHLNLDAKQKRHDDKRTPVEQAFSYAPKNGEDCKWVIVSNYLEIRLYISNDSTKYERFYIEKLNTEEEEFKKFIFLLHKTRFISKTFHSQIEKLYQSNNLYNEIRIEENTHILDKIYNCIKKFDGFGYVNPQIISNAYPFNENITTDNYVYEDYAISTNNEEVYNFFSIIKSENNNITIDDTIIEELSFKVFEVQKKIAFIIGQLNSFLILNLIFKNEKTRIAFQMTSCTCISCKLDSMLIQEAVTETYSLIGTDKSNNLPSAYFLYRIPIENYKYSYLSYKSLRKNCMAQGKDIEYFIATYNQKYIGKFLKNCYSGDDAEVFLEDCNNIDLQYEVNTILQTILDKDVREVLLELYRESFNSNLDFRIDKCLNKIKKNKNNLENGGTCNCKSIANEIIYIQYQLYAYNRGNYLVTEKFTEYKATQGKIFESAALLHLIDQKYKGGLKTMPFFLMKQTIIHLETTQLNDIYTNCSLKYFIVSKDDKEKLLELATNLFGSFSEKAYFGNVSNTKLEYLMKETNFDTYIGNCINNLFFFINRIDLVQEEVVRIMNSVTEFIRHLKSIGHQYLIEVGYFIGMNGNNISIQYLEILLFILLDKYSHKKEPILYEQLIKETCYTIKVNYPNYVITSDDVVEEILYKFKSKNNNLRLLINIYHLIPSEKIEIVKERIRDYLTEKKDAYLYRNVIENNILTIKESRELLELYVKQMDKNFKNYDSRRKSNRLDVFDGTDTHDLYFQQNAQLIYNENLFEDEVVKSVFKDLEGFEGWLINPFKFDYSEFKIEWLHWIYNWYAFFKRLKTIKELKTIIESHLKENPTDTKISEMYFRFFV